MKTEENKNRDIYLAIILSVLTVATRILFSEKYFLGYDPINFVFGSTSFSLAETRPHLPGYYLFIKILHLYSLFITDKHTAFLALNFTITFLASFFSFLSLRKLFEIKISVFIFLLLIFNPLVWYYGCVTEIYSFDWFLSALVIFISFQKNGVYFLMPLLALGSGLRQSSGVLLFPFVVYLIYSNFRQRNINYKFLLYSLAASVIITAGWFFPMINSTGGFESYIDLYSKNNPVEKISLLQNWFRMTSFMVYFISPIAILFIFSLSSKINYDFYKKNNSIVKLLTSIILIPLLFFIFVHYSKGYMLLISLPIYIFFGILIERNKLNYTVIVITILFEMSAFIFLPYRETRTETLLNRKSRSENLISVWFERTFSSYSMTSGRIKSESEKISSLLKLIVDTDVSKLFIDPTLSHYARILQYYLPDVKFIILDLHDDEKIVQFSNLSVDEVDASKINWSNVLVLTRMDFLKSFLNVKPTDSLIVDSNYAVFALHNSKKNSIMEKYQEYFSRNQ